MENNYISKQIPEGLTFPKEIIENFNNRRYCVQCSGCHGCR